MTIKPPRVVIDTNVFIRYLIRPGAAIRRSIDEMWLEDQIVVLTSPELFDELERVLERESIRKLIHPSEGQALLEALQMKAEFTHSLGDIPAYTRDAKDDKFIACAIAAQAGYLITKDRDLLALGDVLGFQIITPYAYLMIKNV